MRMQKIGTRKLTDRLIIILISSIILAIILLIFNINVYLSMSKKLERSKYEKDERGEKRDFKKKLERSVSIASSKSTGTTAAKIVQPIETFHDLHDAIDKLEEDLLGDVTSRSTDIKPNPTLGELLHMNITQNTTSLDRFHMQINAHEMYPENSNVDQLLNDMATLPIHKVEEMLAGTQFKMTITYDNGMRALFKPKRYERDQQNPPNQIYYAEFERHNAEIATFHVDRLLGFHRAFPTVGRTINIDTEMKLIANPELQKTFFISLPPDENVCFTGNCHQFCDTSHAICANGHQLEGAFIAYMPDAELLQQKHWVHPYKRTYDPRKKADWETNSNYCDEVKKDYPLEEGRHLLDIIDTAILDFLIGNRDRHNFQTFEIFDNPFHMHYDHGRSFGRPFFDDMSALAPLSQCCVIRVSTLKTLLNYHHGPKPLSAALRESLAKDPVAPVLWEPHLTALDRRVEEILKQLRECIDKKPIKSVIIFS